MPSEKEFKFNDYVKAIETLKQEIDNNLINTMKKILNYLIIIEEQTKRKDLIQFISQLLYDFAQINDMLRKYSNTENTQFQKLFYIFASNISDIVIYCDLIEELLNIYNDTNEQYSEFLIFKDLNTFNKIQARMNEYIEENRFDSEIILEFLTKTIMSNSPIVRGSAVKTLISNYPVKSIPLLRKWAGKEVSISVVRKIWKHLDKSNYEEHHQLLNVLLHKISKCNYNLDPNEVKFLLDWTDEEFESQFPWFRILHLDKDYMEFLTENPPSVSVRVDTGAMGVSFHYEYSSENPTIFHYTDLKRQGRPRELGYYETTILNGHISGLILSYITKIPETIEFLLKLKYLAIEDSEELSVLPNSLKKLRNLRYLYFYETNLSELPQFLALLPKLRYLGLQGIKLNSIPEWVKTKARKYHSRKYIREGVNIKDAYILGLFEILLGIPLENVRKFVENRINEDNEFNGDENDINDIINDAFCDLTSYKINKQGHVTGISLFGENIRCIPKEIKNLKSLEKFYIFPPSRYPVIIPKSVEPFLKSLGWNF